MTPAWFKRGAATTAVFALLGPGLASVVITGLFVVSRESASASIPSPTVTDVLVAAGSGFLIQLGPGLITGLIMSFGSPQIRSIWGWFGWAAPTMTMLSLGAIALLLRTSFVDVGIGPVMISMVILTLPGLLGALASAGATLRFRPRPSPKPTAEVFA